MTSRCFLLPADKRRALRIGGAVAVVAGLHQVVTGNAGVVGNRPDLDGWRDPESAAALRNVDSELRFYGAWYATAGALMLRAAAGPRVDRGTRRLLGLGWLLAATGRVLSIRAVGRPHPLFVALGAAELALAAELLAPCEDAGE